MRSTCGKSKVLVVISNSLSKHIVFLFQYHHSLKAQMIRGSYTLDCYTPQKIIKCILVYLKILSGSAVSSTHIQGQQVSVNIGQGILAGGFSLRKVLGNSEFFGQQKKFEVGMIMPFKFT